MSDIIPFDFEGSELRSTVIEDEPWFVGNDVCSVLGISDPRQAVSNLDEEERGVYSIPTPSGQQEMRIINESGLYSLIFKSRKAAAKRFKKWVTSEVLPTIRKTGGYGKTTANTDKLHELGEKYVATAEKLLKTQSLLFRELDNKRASEYKMISMMIRYTDMSDADIARTIEGCDDLYVEFIRKRIAREEAGLS